MPLLTPFLAGFFWCLALFALAFSLGWIGLLCVAVSVGLVVVAVREAWS